MSPSLLAKACLEILRFDSTPERQEAHQNETPHFHICGFSFYALELVQVALEGDLIPIEDWDEPNLGLGCGHLWGPHAPDFPTAEAHEAAHMCPACGLGPWRLALDQPLIDHLREKDLLS